MPLRLSSPSSLTSSSATIQPVNMSDYITTYVANTSPSALSQLNNTPHTIEEYYDRTTEDDKIRVLLAMNLGHTPDLSKDKRLLAHIKGGNCKHRYID